MLVIINKDTNRHVMSQDGDIANKDHMKAMKANAESAGLENYEIASMTPAELAELIATQPKTPEEKKADAINAIAALEAKQPRALREAVLSGDAKRLEAIEAEIAKLRKSL